MTTRIEPLLRAADEALRSQKLDEAAVFLLRALDMDAAHAGALGRLGLIHLQKGETAAARERLGAAVRAAPRSAAAWFHLGLAHRDEEAQRCFGAALVLDPGFLDALHAMGGIARLRRGLRLDPSRTDLRRSLDLAVLIASRSHERALGLDDALRPLPPQAAGPPPSVLMIDPIGWDYDVSTPARQPLGGSQSALCYLSLALAGLGVRVATMTGTREPRVVAGVDCRNLNGAPPVSDIAVILNAPAAAAEWRAKLPPGCRLVLWTQHAPDQPTMQALDLPEIAGAFDAIVCVSDWHRASLTLRFGDLPIVVQRNGIAPAFRGLFRDAADLAEAKSGPPVLIYNSTPFRGLELLLDVFPELRAEFPDLRLDLYSSLKVYHNDGPDPYQRLYDRAAAGSGIRHFGSIGQSALALELSHAHFLSYPNQFPETSCIAVMEALAAGLEVTTSHLAALPETTLGLARLVTIPARSFDQADYRKSFSAAQRAAILSRNAEPQRWIERRYADAAAANEAFAWERRARTWLALLSGLALPN